MASADEQKVWEEKSIPLGRAGFEVPGKPVIVPLESELEGLVVELQVNGEPIKLVVDTGASWTTISREHADRLGLEVEGEDALVRSASGKLVAMKRVPVDRLTINGAWREGSMVMLTEFPDGMEIDGVLVNSTLAAWDVRIDPGKLRLTLFPRNESDVLEGETRLKLERHQNLMVRVPLGVGEHRIQVVPDTGYGGTVQLSLAQAKAIVPNALANSDQLRRTSVSIAGEGESRDGKIPQVTFGPDTLVDLPVSFVETEANAKGMKIDLIGLNFLQHYVMTFRFGRGELGLLPIGTVQELVESSTAGISIGVDPKGAMIAQSLAPDGPGEKAGLRAGDHLVEIGGIKTSEITNEDFRAFRRQPPGTKVEVVYRRGDQEPAKVVVVLEKE
ncbi:MAG: aspartyl protease family protein [Verrucomicrobiota bacterium]